VRELDRAIVEWVRDLPPPWSGGGGES
jgi:hypothetical protein